MSNRWPAGELIHVNAECIDPILKVDTDPTSVKLTVTVNGTPITGSPFTYTLGSGDPSSTIKRASVGNYYADLDTTGKPGNWHCVYTGAGQLQAVREVYFIIYPVDP